MSGRGDNNKHGSSGRGASNQSNQGMEHNTKQGKSNHNKHEGEGKASITQKKTRDQSADRNLSSGEGGS